MGYQFMEGQFLKYLNYEASQRLLSPLITYSRLEKTCDDMLKGMQKERHTYRKKKTLGISHTEGSKGSSCYPEPWLTRHPLCV